MFIFHTQTSAQRKDINLICAEIWIVLLSFHFPTWFAKVENMCVESGNWKLVEQKEKLTFLEIWSNNPKAVISENNAVRHVRLLYDSSHQEKGEKGGGGEERQLLEVIFFFSIFLFRVIILHIVHLFIVFAHFSKLKLSWDAKGWYSYMACQV